MTQQYTQQNAVNNTAPNPWAESENNMSTESKISYTVKTAAGNLFTLRGDSGSEFNAVLVEFLNSAEILANMGQIESAVKAGAIQVGAQLGGTATEPHQNQAQLQDQGIQTQPQQAPQQNQYQQAQGGYQPQGGQQVQAQPQGAPAPAGGAEPQGPFLPGIGQNAKYREGTSKKTGNPYKQFVDPRPYQVTKNMQRTQDPNDPGIANGTHQFMTFL